MFKQKTTNNLRRRFWNRLWGSSLQSRKSQINFCRMIRDQLLDKRLSRLRLPQARKLKGVVVSKKTHKIVRARVLRDYKKTIPGVQAQREALVNNGLFFFFPVKSTFFRKNKRQKKTTIVVQKLSGYSLPSLKTVQLLSLLAFQNQYANSSPALLLPLLQSSWACLGSGWVSEVLFSATVTSARFK